MNALCPACHHPERMHSEIGEWCARCGAPCTGRRPATPFHLEVTPYAEIRSQLRDFDIALFWGRGALSWTISRLTKGPSHASDLIIHRDLDIVFARESVEGQGHRVVMFSRLIEDERTRYDGAVVILRHRQPANPAADRAAARVSLSDLGEGYGYRTLALAGLRKAALALSPRLEQRLRDRYDVLRTVFICSEKTAETQILRGKPLDLYASPVPEPADLWRDSHLEVVARVL